MTLRAGLVTLLPQGLPSSRTSFALSLQLIELLAFVRILSLEAVGLKMKTLKNGEIKKLAQGHPATKPLSGRSWAPNKAICPLSPCR